MTLENMLQFEQEILEKDFDSIFAGSINKIDLFNHCVIAYETEHNEIIDIKMCLLDKDLDTVEELSLNEYIKPDYAKLTTKEEIEIVPDIDTEVINMDLVSLKNKIIVKLKNSEKQSE